MRADVIRQTVLDRFLAPGFAKGETKIVVRSGDIHKAMHLNNAMPAVCSALLSETKMAALGLSSAHVGGPNPSSTTLIAITRTAENTPRLSWRERLARVR